MGNFLKGIVTGLGAVAPGLSGSVLLVIFGLYRRVIDAIGSLFKNFKKSFRFLLPLGSGILLGVIVFSMGMSVLLERYEMYTRFAFLGLVVGSLPIFWREVKKEGFKYTYYIYIAISLAAGLYIFVFNRSYFPKIEDPNLLQSVLLGVVVSASYIVPGIDSGAILSTLGLYELWLNSIKNFDFAVLLPAAAGMVMGFLAVSFIINRLIKRFYTATFAIIFGFFLSVIPGILNESCALALNLKSLLSVILMLLGFAASICFGIFAEKNGEKQEIKKGDR